MQTRATMSPGYLTRVIAVTVVTLIGGVWFSYDGFVSYPRQRQRGLAYQRFQKEDRISQWRDYARAQGWSVTPEMPKSMSDIWLQRILGVTASVVGLFFLMAVLRSIGRWIACDEHGLKTSGDLSISYDHIVKLDTSRWQKKGIVIVYYEQEGKKGRLVLDDWKYHQDAIETIYRTLQDRINSRKKPASSTSTQVSADVL